MKAAIKSLALPVSVVSAILSVGVVPLPFGLTAGVLVWTALAGLAVHAYFAVTDAPKP